MKKLFVLLGIGFLVQFHIWKYTGYAASESFVPDLIEQEPAELAKFTYQIQDYYPDKQVLSLVDLFPEGSAFRKKPIFEKGISSDQIIYLSLFRSIKLLPIILTRAFS